MANYLTTFRGTLSTGTLSEIFSHSLAVISSQSAATLAEDLVQFWTAIWSTGGSSLQQWFPTSVIYTEATAAQIMNLTSGELGAAQHYPFTPALPGMVSGTALPSQNAIAVSLTAGLRANGTPIKGRFYLPTPVTTDLMGNGLLSNGVRDGIGAGIADFIVSMQGAGHTPAVWSRKEGKLSSVDKLRVGNKVDTVRRRRNKLPEVYFLQEDLVP